MKPGLVLLLLSTMSLLMLWRAPTRAVSATCNPLELTPCSGAILSGEPPTAACCGKLKAQQPCFCQYKRNPALRGYVNSDNGKKMLATCGVPTPSC